MPDGSGLVVVSDIYPDCGVDPACIKDKTTAEGSAPTKARVLTGLLYRHWKAWQEPTRSHIVYVPLDGGTPRDLTPGAFDAPPFSVGGGDEFDVSPDGKELVFARDTEEHPEVSTNSDLFIVPIARRRREAHHHAHRRGHVAAVLARRPLDRLSLAGARRLRIRSVGAVALRSHDRHVASRRRRLSTTGSSRSPGRPTRSRCSSSRRSRAATRSTKSALDGKLAADRRLRFRRAPSPSPRRQDALLRRARRSTGPTDIYAVDKTRRAPSQRLTHENDALLTSLAIGATHDVWWTGAEGAQRAGLIS